MSSEQPPQDQAPRRGFISRFRREARATGAPPVRTFPIGRLVLGLVLVAIGVIWLLGALDVVNFSFLAVLPVALIIVGLALLAMARTGRHSGLIALGIVLTVILTIASGFDIRLRGGVGDRTERPATLADVKNEYHLSIGQLVIDLRSIQFPEAASRTIKASVGMGQLTVRVPAETFVRATAHAGAGQVSLFGREGDGLDVDLSGRAPLPPGFLIGGGTPQLILDLTVGLGQVEVSQ